MRCERRGVNRTESPIFEPPWATVIALGAHYGPSIAPTRLAVLPFTTPGGSIYGYLAQLLSRNLAGSATEEYSRFVALWRACDAALQPVVEIAKAELAALAAEPR